MATMLPVIEVCGASHVFTSPLAVRCCTLPPGCTLQLEAGAVGTPRIIKCCSRDNPEPPLWCGLRCNMQRDCSSGEWVLHEYGPRRRDYWRISK